MNIYLLLLTIYLIMARWFLLGAWTIVQLVAVLRFVAVFSEFVWRTNRGALWQPYMQIVARQWPRTTAWVEEAKLVEGQARIRYRYSIRGASFQSKRLRFDRRAVEVSQARLLESLAVGARLNIAYDPNRPDRAVAFPGLVARNYVNLVRALPLDSALAFSWIAAADLVRYSLRNHRFLLCDWHLGHWILDPSPPVAILLAIAVGLLVSGVAAISFLWFAEMAMGELGLSIAAQFALVAMAAFTARLAYRAQSRPPGKVTCLKHYIANALPILHRSPSGSVADAGDDERGSLVEPGSPSGPPMAYTKFPDGRITICV